MAHQTADGVEGLRDAAAHMHSVLIDLQETDNEVRRAAERVFHRAMEHKGLCLDALATLSVTPDNQIVRSTALLLLGQWGAELWNDADDYTKNSIKEKLVAGIRVEERKDLRKKLCNTIAAIGSPLIRETPSQWPELMPMMLDFSKSTVSYERESALYIFSLLADYVDANDFTPYLPSLKSAFHAGLSDHDRSVQISGLHACCSMLNMLDTNACQQFVDLIPLMLNPVQNSIQVGDEDGARACIELLIDVVETEPMLWKNYLALVCTLMFAIASNTKLSQDACSRQMAMEFLVSIAENFPSQCRKMGTFAQRAFSVCLNMMLELKDDSDWYEKAEEEHAGEHIMFDCGKGSLNRIAISLGGKAVLPVAEAIVPRFLQNDTSWVHRHTALLALSQIGNGCQKHIEPKLTHLIDLALNRFGDPHPRVRWAAINCIDQLCTDFGPSIQIDYHFLIVPHIIEAMDDSANPRLQSHAAAAVTNFCDEASSEVFSPYLDALLVQLQGLLQSQHRFTQEQAVTAISAIAGCAEKAFVKYYECFMPPLKNVLSSAAGQRDLRRLRCKVMECISLIGLIVGPEKFGPDTAEVMTAASPQGDDDPHAFYLMQAYARICRCLKSEFIRYLPHVMPGLIKAVEQKQDIHVLEAEDDYDEDGDEEGLRIGESAGIRTSALEETAAACTTIAFFIAELRGGFYNYVEKVTHVIVPLLRFPHGECRTASAGCLPDLVQCVKDSNMELTGRKAPELTFFIMSRLLEAMKREPDVEVLVSMVESLAQIVALVNPHVLNEESQTEICQALSMLILESEARNLERFQMAEQDGWDQEEQEDSEMQQVKEEELLPHIGDCVRAMIKTHSSAGFITVLTQPMVHGVVQEGKIVSLLELFWLRLLTDRPSHERRVALCVFNEVILYGGRQGAELAPKLLEPMRAYCLDPDPDVRQAAACGIGTWAEVGGDGFMIEGGPGVVHDLETVVQFPNSRSQGNEIDTDNAVSALMKILEFQPSALGDAGHRIGELIVNYLPAKEDETEARVMHALLIQALQRNDSRILGQNTVHLGEIFYIFSSILGTPLIDETNQRAAIEFIKLMTAHIAPEVLQNAILNLTAEQKQKLQAVIES